MQYHTILEISPLNKLGLSETLEGIENKLSRLQKDLSSMQINSFVVCTCVVMGEHHLDTKPLH